MYGETLRLPQEFVNHEQQFINQSEFVVKLKEHFKHIQPTQTRNHPENSFVDKHLRTYKRVLIRKDHAKLPLELSYNGPFKVVTQKAKFFKLLIDSKHKTVSVDRLKMFIEVEEDCSLKTKSGRIIRPPDRYKSCSNSA